MPRSDPHHEYQAELFHQWNEWNSEAAAALTMGRHARTYRNIDFGSEEHAVHQSRDELMAAMADLRDAEADDWEQRRDLVEAKRQEFETAVATLRRRAQRAQEEAS